MTGAGRWVRENGVLLGGVVLVSACFWVYLSSPYLPGNAPQGWWTWFDQGKTLESAQAFARRDLAAVHHWYPPGYALLGALFLRFGFRAHPFVFVDLACLLASYAGFVAFARACGIGRAGPVLLFIGAAFWDRQIFMQWAIPWNTTPAAALLWAILVLCGSWLGGRQRPVLLGALVCALPWFRPAELAPAGMCLVWVLIADWRARRLRRQAVLGLAAGGLLSLAPLIALHLAIYGPAPSEYMRASRELGFTFADLGWKAYVVLADPYPWFGGGQGLLQRVPWTALALAGLIPALVRGGAAGMLAAALGGHLVLYVSYVDLLPPGLWRFNNVHYWSWAFPGYALLAWQLARDLANWPWRGVSRAAACGLAVTGLLAFLRVEPRPAAGDEPAKMLEFHGETPSLADSYFADIALRDAKGRMRNVVDFRAIPVRGGMRLIALRRDFDGPVVFEPDHTIPAGLAASEPSRFAERILPRPPCWPIAAWCGQREPDLLLRMP